MRSAMMGRVASITRAGLFGEHRCMPSSCNGHPRDPEALQADVGGGRRGAPEGHPVGDKVFIKHPYPNTLTYVFVFSGRTVCREHPTHGYLRFV